MRCIFLLAVLLADVVVTLGGCAGGSRWQVQMMPRDSGTVYSGVGQGDGSGGGSVAITIEGRTYTGPVVRTAANESFGFFQAYGSRGVNAIGGSQSFGGTVYVKGILSSPDNRGLRCDLTGDGHGHLGGICVDDKGRVYDVVASR
jgi:hypothetical protein